MRSREGERGDQMRYRARESSEKRRSERRGRKRKRLHRKGNPSREATSHEEQTIFMSSQDSRERKWEREKKQKREMPKTKREGNKQGQVVAKGMLPLSAWTRAFRDCLQVDQE